MKARCSFTLLLVLVSLIPAAAARVAPSGSESVALETRHIRGARAHIITADLNDPRIRIEIGLPRKGISHSEPFLSMVRRRAPLAAVTGTYFDTRSLIPVGSIVTGGQRRHEGAIGTVVCFLRPNGLECAVMPSSYTVKFTNTRKGQPFDWTGVDCGFRAGPRLLADGSYVLNPRPEGFRHPGLFGSRTRMAMGITARNKLLLVAVRTPVTFGRLAGIMKSLGALDAMALDGGTSSAMYYRGRAICLPGRALTNVIEIHRTEHIQARPVPVLAAIPQLSALDKRTAKDAPETVLIRQEREEPAEENDLIRRFSPCPLPSPKDRDVPAMMPSIFVLSLAQGRLPVFPVNRTKLAGLKRPNNSKNLFNIASHAKVMHHLVA